MGLSWDSTGISVEYGTLMMDLWNIMMDIYIYHGISCVCEYSGIYIST
jgi:hypothetical protein